MAAADAWVIVCGGFHEEGGMDRANAAVATYLAARGARVHLVTHRVDGVLKDNAHVCASIVPRHGLWFTSDLTLDRRARDVVTGLRRAGGRVRVIANGGNCTFGDVNWVHSLHHAWPCRDEGAPAWFRLKNRAFKTWARRRERRAIAAARLVIANSNRTRAEVVSHLDVPSERVHTVYLGSPEGWRPPDAGARERARRAWCTDPALPLFAFIGALGHDLNKGVDRVLDAWERIGAAGWRGELVIAGGGDVERWKRRASAAACPVRFAGHTTRTGELLDASDLFVSPVRYEAYGLAAHEALCRGVPTVISATAGIVERIPRDLDDLLLPDPEDVHALVARMRLWAADPQGWRTRTCRASQALLRYSENDMAAEMVALARGTV